MAVTPRIREVAEQVALSFEDRYPGYRAALVKALDEVVAVQWKVHVGQRREDVTKFVDALGRAAVAAAGGSS